MSSEIFCDNLKQAQAMLNKGERDERGHLKHINCEGARFHVISYGKRRYCSEPECAINFEDDVTNEQ
jgi:hypothetical protein